MIKTKAILIVLIILSSLTSVATISKVLARNGLLTATDSRTNIQEVEVLEPTSVPTKIPTSIPIARATSTPRPSAVPTAVITPKPTSAPISNSNLCIITLQGQQYNVTSLRSTHSGGDIFKCGTDMTAVYQGKHGISLVRMQSYLYNSGTVTISNQNPTPTTKNTNKDKDEDEYEDDREDEEHEDRYFDD